MVASGPEAAPSIGLNPGEFLRMAAESSNLISPDLADDETALSYGIRLNRDALGDPALTPSPLCRSGRREGFTAKPGTVITRFPYPLLGSGSWLPCRRVKVTALIW